MWYDTRNDCGSITIDINGAKQPNKAGYDVFEFTVWSNRTGKPYWDVMGSSSLFSILSGGKLKYNKNNQKFFILQQRKGAVVLPFGSSGKLLLELRIAGSMKKI